MFSFYSVSSDFGLPLLYEYRYAFVALLPFVAVVSGTDTEEVSRAFSFCYSVQLALFIELLAAVDVALFRILLVLMPLVRIEVFKGLVLVKGAFSLF